MHFLLDQSVPVALAARFGHHQVLTASGLSWAGTRNGQVLARIEGRFAAPITMDSDMAYQQAMLGRPLVCADSATAGPVQRAASCEHRERRFGSCILDVAP